MKPLRLLAAFLLAAAVAHSAEKPNVVFLLADDIGYADLSCFGAKHAKTPNLDRLAAQGCRFTDAHSPASTCTPTRRAFLTGVYSWRQQPGSSIAPGDAPLSIPVGTPTVASIMKQAGYRTGVVGKWHIGLGPQPEAGSNGGPDWNGDIKPGPMEIGFDSSFIMAATGDRTPTVYVDGHRIVGLDPRDPITVSYKSKVGTDPTGAENPELLKLKHTHGHDMTIVNGVGRIGWMTGGNAARWKDEDMGDTFAGKAIKFIEESVSTSSTPSVSTGSAPSAKPFFLYFATHNIHVPRVPHPRFKGTSSVGTRGDAIHELDDAVGKVMAKLDEMKLTEKTLFIFTSDNGGVMDDGYEDVGSFDYNPNAPLNGHKGNILEGGHRVPFIARWPGKIKPGTTSDALIAHLDMPATFAAITGVKIPDGGCRDSINVLPVLLGETQKSPRETFVAHNGGVNGPFGIRVGNWKLNTAGAGPGANDPRRGGAQPKAQRGNSPDTRRSDALPSRNDAPGNNVKPAQPGGGAQLFDLSTDLGETKNLATEKPAKVKEMQELLAKLREK